MRGQGEFWRELLRKATAWESVRRLAIATALALTVFTTLLIAGFLNAAGDVDNEAHAAEQRRAQTYLENYARSVASQMKVQLTWDDALKATGGKVDADWADDYLGNFFWTSFQYDPVLLFDGNGRPLRAWRQGHPIDVRGFKLAGRLQEAYPRLLASEQTLGMPARIDRFGTIHWPVTGQGSPLSKWSYTFVEYGNGPALAVMVPILPDSDFSLLRGAPMKMIAVIPIDRAFLAEMGNTTMVGTPWLRRPIGGVDAKSINETTLRDETGKPVSVIAWKSAPLNEQLRERMQPLFVVFVGFLILLVGGGISILAILWRNSRELAISEAQAMHSSHHDEMTGLPNRRQFMFALQQRLDKRNLGAARSDFAVAFFDIDRFKMVNDTMGHHVGDELVSQVAERLRRKLPASDNLARIGGDEFVLMRPGATTRGDCAAIGREIEAIMAPAFDVCGNQLHVTVSCGIIASHDARKDADTILRNADIAMYEAKQAGRACWRVFTEAMDASLRWRHEIETDLRRAIEVGDLALAYQPIVDVETGRITCLEALLRWNHPVRGEIDPDVFVPIAEQSGLMAPLGHWVLRRAFEDVASLPGVDISINLSPLQVTAQGFVNELKRMIRETGVDPRRIVLEVTEGVLLDASAPVLAVLEKLKAMGFRIALDDFGTGFSSLSYLRSFRFDLIKVDRSFVQHIEVDLNSLSILKAIVSLGRSLGMKVVAEGVETLLQRQLVHSAGCQWIQGNLYWSAQEVEQASTLVSGKSRLVADDQLAFARIG